MIKAKDLGLLVVEEDPVALWVEDSQVGVFQEEDHQEEPQEEPQEEELQDWEETQSWEETHLQNLTVTALMQVPS